MHLCISLESHYIAEKYVETIDSICFYLLLHKNKGKPVAGHVTKSFSGSTKEADFIHLIQENEVIKVIKMDQRTEKGELRNFLSKIKQNYSSKFAKTLPSSIHTLSTHVDKDGETENDTLIHKAFVQFFEKKGEPYPDWLGEKGQDGKTHVSPYADSPYQPVYAEYNSDTNPIMEKEKERGTSKHEPRVAASQSSLPQRPSNYPRTSSRLQDMHNKSRQQAIPGSGYNAQLTTPARSNSGLAKGSRLRERVLNNPQRAPLQKAHTFTAGEMDKD